MDSRNIRWNSCKYVPTKDKALVFQHIYNENGLTGAFSAGTWARFTCGLFKNDIGYVWKVLGPDFIRIAVIPRMWDQSVSALKRKLDTNGRAMKRAPQMLMSEDVLETMDKKLFKSGPDESSFCVGDELYLTLGLRLLDVYAIHAVTPADPSASEVSLFTELHLNTRRITNKAFMSIGDTVDIVSGNFCGRSGSVKSILDSGLCSIEAMDQEEQQITTYLALLDDIERRFKSGVTVTVQLGPFSGRSGYVVALTSDTLTIIDDSSMLEVRDLNLKTAFSDHMIP